MSLTRDSGDLRRLAAVPAAAVLAIMLGGCGLTYFGSSPDQPTPVTCTLGATGADVEVQVAGSVPCGQEIQAFASYGLNWYPITVLAVPGAAGAADSETMWEVCQLSYNGSVLTVMDAGGGAYGQQICSSNEQGGWEPS